MSVYRDDRIPDSGPVHLLRRVPANAEELYICLSEKVFGCWLHWLGTHSEPCGGDPQDCRHCFKGKPRKWRGYIHCFFPEKKVCVFLELTPDGARQLVETAGRSAFRGARLRCKRGNGKTARLKVECLGFVEEERVTVPAIDPIVQLEKIWRKTNSEDGSAMPV